MMDATRGHELFEQWLIETYGASEREGSAGRPAWTGMKKLIEDLGAAVAEISPKLEPIKQAYTVYHWLASAQPGTIRRPSKHIRFAIEMVSDGAVPRGAWDEPAQKAA